MAVRVKKKDTDARGFQRQIHKRAGKRVICKQNVYIPYILL